MHLRREKKRKSTLLRRKLLKTSKCSKYNRKINKCKSKGKWKRRRRLKAGGRKLKITNKSIKRSNNKNTVDRIKNLKQDSKELFSS